MSEKKLKQLRLPFQIISSSPGEKPSASPTISTPKPVLKDTKASSTPKSSKGPKSKTPKTPKSSAEVASRKRRQSTELESNRSTKIVRTSDSKENIVSVITIEDSHDSGEAAKDSISVESDIELLEDDEKTPTTAKHIEKTVSIKLPSCSKSKRNRNLSEAFGKPRSQDDEDDSVVYLDDEEIRKSTKKKSTKKGSKKVLKKKKAKKDLSASLEPKLSTENELADIEESELVISDDDIPMEDDPQEELREAEPVAENIKQNDVGEILDSVKILEKEKIPESPELAQEIIQTDSPVESTSVKEDSPADLDISISPASSELPIEDDVNTTLGEALESDIPETTEQLVKEDSDSNISSISKASTSKELQEPEQAEQIKNSAEKSKKSIELSSDDESPNNDLNNSSTEKSINTKAMTPKQLKWHETLEQRRRDKEEKKQKEREQRELIKQKEFELKKKERDEKEELKRKERVEKEELKRKEREDKLKERLAKEQKRLAEIEQKNEEKRAKDEEKRIKDEERKKMNDLKEEDRKKKELEKLEAEKKIQQQKASMSIAKFFAPKSTKKPMLDEDIVLEEEKPTVESTIEEPDLFMPFSVKGGMRLAPLVRIQIGQERLSALDLILKSSTVSDKKGLYVQQLKSGVHKPIKTLKTLPFEEEDDEVTIIDELADIGEDIEKESTKVKATYHTKFLYFEENKRPAYYGTWRKITKFIHARKPFGQDPKYFDYEVDSDDEWEEEEPGESLHGSDDDKDKDSEGDDYEVDNEFFVPHGHLSEEEMQQQNEDGEDGDEGGMDEDNSPETQKAKLKILQQEFAAEMKKKTEKIKPRLIGCVWMNGDEDFDGATLSPKKYHCSDVIWKVLKSREILCDSNEISFEIENRLNELAEEEEQAEEECPSTPATPAIPKRMKITEDLIGLLIQLVHGNTNGKKFMAKEFHAHHLKMHHREENFVELMNLSIELKINEIAEYRSCTEAGPMFGKSCWNVRPDVMKQFDVLEVKLPNEWEYTLTKPVNVKSKAKKSLLVDGDETAEDIGKKETKIRKVEKVAESPKPSTNVKQSAYKRTANGTPVSIGKSGAKPTSSDSKDAPPPKKRVQLLMSVPRGENISDVKKNALISDFLQKGSKKPAAQQTLENIETLGMVSGEKSTPMVVDETVVIE